jgi:hypothetical protein
MLDLYDNTLCHNCGDSLILARDDYAEDGYCCKECTEGESSYGLPMRMYQTLAHDLGDTNTINWSKIIYKSTDCGASLTFPFYGVVCIGSIVEGAEYDCEGVQLKWPFTRETFWDAVKDVEDQADIIWSKCND